MKNSEAPESKSRFKSAVVVILLIILLYTSALVVIYLLNLSGEKPDSYSELGAVGDFFGGTLNPFLTLGTIILLIFSITYQLDELRLTRNELKNQLNEQRQNNQTQLRIAELSEKSLNLPALAESVNQKRIEYSELMSESTLVNEYTVETEGGNGKDCLEVSFIAGGISGAMNLKRLIKFYIENGYESIRFDETSEAKLAEFIDYCGSIRELLDEYLENGGSLYIAKELSLGIEELCFVLQDTENTNTLPKKAKELMAELHEFTKRYFTQKKG